MDRAVVIATIAACAFVLGLDYGKSAPVICPASDGEQLVSITISGTTTICTYISNIQGRAVRRVKS